MSASISRPVPSVLVCTVRIKIPAMAAWLKNSAPSAMKPRPIASATHSSTNTATPTAAAPFPSSAATPTPIAMPSSTPAISWTARCARRSVLVLIDTVAAIGAKNGWTWPTSEWAMK